MANLENALKAVMNCLNNKKEIDGERIVLFAQDGSMSGRINTNVAMGNDDAVDLGLPSGKLWSRKNIGAFAEEEIGFYFSWGNVEGQKMSEDSSTPNLSLYDFSAANYEGTKGAKIDKDIPLDCDMARANIGGKWRVPTQDEYTELYNHTDQEVATVNGVKGVKFKSKTDANKYIFLPFGGDIYDTTRYGKGSEGRYWLGTPESSGSSYCIRMEDSSTGAWSSYSGSRYAGFNVRPIL